MRQIFALLGAMIALVMLTSCETHFGGQSIDVKWWVIAIPTLAVLLLTFFIVGWQVSKRKYVCPRCNGRFYPKWWQGAFTVHMNGDRVLKCPHCGKKGFCHLAKEEDL